MTLHEYQILAARTSQWQPGHPDHGKERHRAYGAISLSGESGEVVDLLKKHQFNGHPIDRAKLVEESGDVMWSVACIADAHGFDVRLRHLACTGLGLTYPSLHLGRAAGIVVHSIARMGETTSIDLANVVGALESCIAPHGITIEEACEHNVSKLRKRYPDGYSDAASIARRDVREVAG